MIFKGKITKNLETKGGTTEKGEWANASFVVKETVAEHPQTAIFSMFKNGEHVDFAKSFATKNPVGTEVEVEFNMDVREWTSPKGEVKYFGENKAWKVTKLETAVAAGSDDEDSGDLPF